jgi:hypothetical protein
VHVVDGGAGYVHAGEHADLVERAAHVVVGGDERVCTGVVVGLVVAAADAHPHASSAADAQRHADFVHAGTTQHDSTAVRTATVHG